jgi:4-hydroxy-3-methylbut-2-enyl diphosphate reductase
MKIVIAKMSGFCMGVRRAVETVLDAPEKHPAPICTYGPLIHNPQVLELLQAKGIAAITEIPERVHGTVLISLRRAAGHQKAAEGGRFQRHRCHRLRVIRLQSIIRRHAWQGFAVVIIGEKTTRSRRPAGLRR